MVNSTAILTIDEVKTPAERIHYLNQECITTGMSVSFLSYIGGIVVIPYLIKLSRVPVSMEYRYFSSALASAAISYCSGVYVKKWCEEDIKRQLDEKLNA